MAWDYRRSALHLMLALVLAALLCLLFPKTVTAATADIGKQMVMDVQVPADAEGCAFEQEVGVALKLGYMNLIDEGFNPAGEVLAKDFVACVGRGMAKVGLPVEGQPTPDDPEAPITRQQAVKLLVTSILTADQIELICRWCGGPRLYLSDFFDADDVASWARPYYTVAVYNGWIPDASTLSPEEAASREYVAALVARAFPDPDDFSGLAVYVDTPDFRRAQLVQLVSDGLGSSPQILYPDPGNMPSYAFFGAPGIVSYCGSLEEAKERRVGSNPLGVVAAEVRKGDRGAVQVVLSPDDAVKVWGADATGLFRRTWKVAIIMGSPVEIQVAQDDAAPAAPSETPEPEMQLIASEDPK